MSISTLTYLVRDISKTPLLTFAQEQRLGKSIQAGIVAAKRLSANDSTILPEERAGLEALIRQGEQARDSLVEANVRLAISVATKFQGRGIPLEDLIQEANVGLMKAAGKFEPERGYKFSTYATWWIRQSVTRAIADQGRTIRLPVHLHDKVNKCLAINGRLRQERGRNPSHAEIARELNGGTTPAEVRELLAYRTPILSLNVPMPTEGSDGAELVERLESDGDTPDMVAEQAVFATYIDKLIFSLTPREERIIRLRFGLSGEGPLTLEEVAKKYGLTRERIRQIEGGAMKKLRLALARGKI